MLRVTVKLVSLALILLALAACASTVDLSDPRALMDGAASNGAFSNPLEPVSNMDVAYSLFGLDRARYGTSLFYMSTATSEAFVYMQASDSDAYNDAIVAIERRTESQKQLYASYAPEEVTKLENARILRDATNRIIVYVVADDYSKLTF